MTSDGLTRLLYTRNPDTADSWVATLDEAGIDVMVEIMDSAVAAPGSSPLVGVLGARPLDFVHVLKVQPGDRERALGALVDAGWDGREGTSVRTTPNIRGMLVAMGYTVAGIAAFLLIRWLAS
jgi:hypothetical protein